MWRFRLLKWGVPVGCLVAALVLWLVIDERRSQLDEHGHDAVAVVESIEILDDEDYDVLTVRPVDCDCTVEISTTDADAHPVGSDLLVRHDGERGRALVDAPAPYTGVYVLGGTGIFLLALVAGLERYTNRVVRRGVASHHVVLPEERARRAERAPLLHDTDLADYRRAKRYETVALVAAVSCQPAARLVPSLQWPLLGLMILALAVFALVELRIRRLLRPAQERLEREGQPLRWRGVRWMVDNPGLVGAVRPDEGMRLRTLVIASMVGLGIGLVLTRVA